MEGRRLPGHEIAYARRERTTIVATEPEAELLRSIRTRWCGKRGQMAKRVMAAVCERFVGDLPEWPVRCERTEESAGTLDRPPTVTRVAANRIRFVRHGELRENRTAGSADGPHLPSG
jgi:hypothetical protein